MRRAGVGLLLLLLWRIPARADREQVLRDLARMDAEHRDKAAWDRRRVELRREFLKGAGLWPLPQQGPYSVLRHSVRQHDGYTVENVAIETLPGFYCTGNLYRPTAPFVTASRGPGILCPHGHFKPLGRFRAEHQIRCAHLAQLGATVFSYGMVGWQDSTQTTHDDPIVLALQTWNSLKALDFLCSLPEVDSNRIGMTGASGGGTQTLYLALLDDRVKASVPVVILYPWSMRKDCCRCEGGMPVMQAAGTNCIEFAAAIAPRPQLIISVGQDATRDFPQIGFPFVRHAYEAYHSGQRAESVFLPAEAHDFGPSKRAAVYSFLGRNLGFEDRPESLSRIVIERPEQMEVFNASHPLPAKAVHGSAAVGRAFAALPRGIQ
ncbi:MAG TPA: acetylxylan esterase [Planctomycetaceae bacterium]|nr:acetylxylan esterase [Planctomycetaceae bacterium]